MSDAAALPDTQRQLEDLRALLEITRAMNAQQDLGELLSMIASEVTRVLDADRSTLFLVDRETEELYSKIAEGEGMTEIRFPIGMGIAGQVAAQRITINIPDAYADERFNQAVDRKTGYRTSSILCMPLVNHSDAVVGVVQVLNKRGGAFGVYDEQLLDAFASQAAVAIDKHQLIQHFLEKQKIQAALQVACEVQQRLLPSAPPQVPNYDLAALSESCDETGGDYYDYLVLGDGHLGLVCADVSGHGVGAALLMATARATLRALVDASAGDISNIFARVNNLLEGDTRDEQFVTMFYGALDTTNHHLVFTNAGHDSPLLFRAATDVFDELESTSFPLGMLEEVDFPAAAGVTIDAGDILLIMTDGIWECMNHANETFGRARVEAEIRALRDRTADEIASGLYQAVKRFRGAAAPRDDMTLLVFKRTG